MKIYIVETCLNYEGCQCVTAFDNLRDAQEHVMQEVYKSGDETMVTELELNSKRTFYDKDMKCWIYNSKTKEWRIL